MLATLSPGHTSLHLLWQRDFRLFVLNLLVWSLGRWMESLALGWLVLELTNSPFFVGAVAAARIGPTLLAPLGGTVADRMDRGRLLGLSQIGAAVIPLTLGVLASTGLIQVAQVFPLVIIAGTVNSFAQPTRQTLVADLAGRQNLMAGNALMRAAVRASFMVGSPLAGLIVARAGVAPCFFLVAALDLFASIFAFCIRPQPKTSRVGRESLWENLFEALRFVRHQPAVLRLLSLEIAFDILVVPYATLMPVMARDVLKVGASGLGILLGASGAGALAGAVGMAVTASPARKTTLLLGAMAALGGVLLCFAASPWYLLSVALLFAAGFLDSVAMTLLPTLLQGASPPNMRGRVMGVYVFTWAAVPVGSLQAGAVASWLGVPFAIGLGGVVVACFALSVGRWAWHTRILG